MGSRVKRVYRQWSRGEEDRLRHLFPHSSTAEVARVMGRSVNSIALRAQRLRLLKDSAYLSESNRQRGEVAWRALTPQQRRARAVKAGLAARRTREAARQAVGERYLTKSAAYLAGYHAGYKRAWSWWQHQTQNRRGMRQAS